MRVQRVLPLVAGVLLATAPVIAGSQPITVSPGDSSQLTLVESRCPTFNWGAVTGAEAYRLVVYQLEEGGGEEAKPVIQATVPGSALGWTPSLDRCLERGGRYAWVVRAQGGDEPSDWSPPNLFRVAAGPSRTEFEQALAVVQQYVANQGGAEAVTAAEVQAESDEPEAPRRSPKPSAVGTTQLSIHGGVVADSFTGDGSTLTSLDPASLSPGSAAIDISGTAASAADLGCAGCVAVSELGFDPATQTEFDARTIDEVSPTATKGDLLVETGATVVALPVGTDGQVLVADSGQGTGMMWATVADPCPICSGPVLLPKTGQTWSYENRDDGELERGVQWPNPRFTDNTDGTVTDNLTQLIWLKDASCAALAGTDGAGRGNWSTAVTAANLLADGICGLTDDSAAGDWRLPNERELHSLVHFGETTPALPNTAGTGKWTEGDAFSGVDALSGLYWSSSTRADLTDRAWGVYFMTGDTVTASKGNTYYVWPVHGGQ